MVNEHDTKLEGDDNRRKLHATKAESQSTATFEDELQVWITRPNQSSSSSPSMASSVKRGPLTVSPTTTSLPSPQPSLHYSPIQNIVQQSHHSGTGIPLNEMAQEALYEAVRRRQFSVESSSGSVNFTSCQTSQSSKKIQRSQKAVERSTLRNMDGPNFDVVAFEQLSDKNEPLTYAIPVQATSNIGLSSTIHKDQAAKPHSIHSSSTSPYSASSHSSRASNNKTRSSHKSNLRTRKHKHSNKAPHDDGADDARSEISQESETTYSSVFTTTCIKLKGYLKHPHNRKSKVLSPEEDLFSLAGHSGVSGRKTPKYRSNKPSTESPTVTTDASVSNSSSPTQRVRFSSFEEGFKSSRSVSTVSLQNIHILEEESSCIGASSVYPNASNSVKVATKGSALSRNTSSSATQVFDLPWVDNASNGKLHGLYSGPVSDLIQPHGEGTLVLEWNSFLIFYGYWVNGELVSPLINADEKRDQQRATSNEYSRKSSSKESKKKSCKEYEKNSSMESKKKPPDQYKKKSSKKCRRRSLTPYVSSSDYIEESDITHSSTIATSKKKPSYRRRPKQKYDLGDVARTPRDMVIHRSNDKAINSASLLKKYDQAFLKRSNGLWTCSVLADRSLQPTTASSSRWYAKHEIDQETMKLEESMLFVINGDGATKIIKKRYWGKFIRRLHRDDEDKEGIVADMESDSASPKQKQ